MYREETGSNVPNDTIRKGTQERGYHGEEVGKRGKGMPATDRDNKKRETKTSGVKKG